MSFKLNSKPNYNRTRQRSVTTLKKIIHAGKGQPIEFVPDTKAIFHYEVLVPPKPLSSKNRTNDGQESEQERVSLFPEERSLYKSIDSTKKCWPDGYGTALELVFGKRFQLPFFENCLKTMLIDEMSQFDVYDPSEIVTYPVLAKKLRDISRADVDKNYDPKKDCHEHNCAASGPVKLGYPELDDLLQNPMPLRFIFHLLKVLKPEEYTAENWQMNETQKLESLDRLREEGNQLFSKDDFAAAAEKYKEALGLVDQLMLREKPNDQEWKELDRRNVPFYLNLSQCYLKLGQYYEAIECASEVLRDPYNEKALFRRAKARIGTWDLDLAKSDLESLESIGPQNNALIHTNLAIIEEKRREKARDERTIYKAMFK